MAAAARKPHVHDLGHQTVSIRMCNGVPCGTVGHLNLDAVVRSSLDGLLREYATTMHSNVLARLVTFA